MVSLTSSLGFLFSSSLGRRCSCGCCFISEVYAHQTWPKKTKKIHTDTAEFLWSSDALSSLNSTPLIKPGLLICKVCHFFLRVNRWIGDIGWEKVRENGWTKKKTKLGKKRGKEPKLNLNRHMQIGFRLCNLICPAPMLHCLTSPLGSPFCLFASLPHVACC